MEPFYSAFQITNTEITEWAKTYALRPGEYWELATRREDGSLKWERWPDPRFNQTNLVYRLRKESEPESGICGCCRQEVETFIDCNGRIWMCQDRKQEYEEARNG